MLMQIKRWGLIISLIGLLILFFYFDLQQFLSFKSLKLHQMILLAWTKQHFALVIFSFMLLYIVIVACLIPGPVFLTLTAGFLFGPLLGSIAVVFSATIGAFILFIAIEFALRDWISKKTTRWLKIMEQGFQENAFNYLLFLRLVPLFPFWIVNIVPALLGVPKKIFVVATFLGIIPGTFVYIMIGNGLGTVFNDSKPPDLSIIFHPRVMLPLIALALLSIVPLSYKFIYNKLKNKKMRP